MPLKAVMDSVEDIPEQYRDLYSERGGKWELTGVEGVKTQADTDRLQTALNKERDDHKKTRETAGVWKDLNYDEVIGKLDRFGELEAAAADKIDDAKLEEMAEARARTRLAPVERRVQELSRANEELTGQVEQFRHNETRRTIGDQFRSAMTEKKVLPEAMEDLLFSADRLFEVNPDTGTAVTRDGLPGQIPPGLSPADYLGHIQPTKGYLWAVGGNQDPAHGGSGNGAGPNPFKAGKDFNLTEQGRITRENPTLAEKLKAAAQG